MTDDTDRAIPEDVMREARDVTHALYPTFDDVGKPFFDTEDVETIARAILAERERCATIADMEEALFCNPHVYDGRYSRGARKASTRIAAAIRKGDTP